MALAPNPRPAGLGTLRLLLVSAMLATLVASAVMVVFLVDAPESGSRTYGLLGAAAAIGGVAATVLFGLSAVWSVVRGLWRHLRMRWRVAVLATALAALVVAAIAATSGA